MRLQDGAWRSQRRFRGSQGVLESFTALKRILRFPQWCFRESHEHFRRGGGKALQEVSGGYRGSQVQLKGLRDIPEGLMGVSGDPRGSNRRSTESQRCFSGPQGHPRGSQRCFKDSQGLFSESQ